LLFPITSESTQSKFSHPNYEVILPKRLNKHVTRHSVKTPNTTITAHVGSYVPNFMDSLSVPSAGVKQSDCLTPAHGTDRLTRDAGKLLPT